MFLVFYFDNTFIFSQVNITLLLLDAPLNICGVEFGKIPESPTIIRRNDDDDDGEMEDSGKPSPRDTFSVQWLSSFYTGNILKSIVAASERYITMFILTCLI